VAKVTSPADRLMARSLYIEGRITMRVYLEVLATILGLLGVFIALTHFVA
jgi:hypothetical protein